MSHLARKTRPRVARLVGLALGVLLLLPGRPIGVALAQDAGLPIAIDAYWRKVQQALETVEALAGADAEAVRTELDALAAEFAAISEVELADGQWIPLDNGYLVARFQDPEPDLDRLAQSLAAILAARERWPDPSHDSHDLDPLAEVLTRPEFQMAEEELGPLQQLWQRIVDSLLDLLFRISPQSAGGLGPLIRLVLTVAGVIALIVALVFTLRGILGDIVADEESQVLDENGLPLLSAEQALEQAHTYSRSGDYRSAVRYLYISSLMLLEERGLVRHDRTQTNQEYLRSVAGKPELAGVLRDVIDVFDRVWYGFQALDEQAFAHYAGRVEQLRQQQ